MLPPDATASGLIALSAVMIAATTIAVTLRFISRRRQKMSLLADDWLMIPAWASFIAACGISFHLIKLKVLGYSSFQVDPAFLAKSREGSQKESIILNLLFTFSLGCIKASILLFYKRIFCVSSRKVAFSIIVTVTVVLIALWTVGYMFFIGFQCRNHFSALWDGTQPKYCQWAFPVIYGQAVSDFIFDVWILVLPLPQIFRLHTNTARKLSLVGIFILGCTGLAASIARLVIFTQIENAGVQAYHMDHERYQSQAGFYMILECSIALFSVNLPSIWPIFSKMSPEALLQSVRSVISLVSVRSRSSKGSQGSQHNWGAIKSARSVSSSTRLPIEGSSTRLPSQDEAFRLDELQKYSRADSRIFVQRSVYQEFQKKEDV